MADEPQLLQRIEALEAENARLRGDARRLYAVVRRTVRLVQRLLPENVHVRVDLGSEGWQVKVDPCQLQTAIVNLAVNSRDAMPIGGELTFCTRTAQLPPHQPDGTPRDVVILAVTDTGVGMDEATQAKIFEPFFTTKDGSHGPKGTGLGLAMVRSFVREGSGEVRVRSAVGAGTTMELVLPRVLSIAARGEARSEPVPIASGEVLVVEDAPGIRRVLTSILMRAGLQPLVYASADQALAAWPELRHRVRVLVTDVVMPGTSGHQLARELRRDRADLGVVFITGYDPEGVEIEGAVLLRKPFTRAQLIEALDAVAPAKVANGGPG